MAVSALAASCVGYAKPPEYSNARKLTNPVIQFVGNLASLFLSPREVSQLGLRQKLSLAYLKTHATVFSLKQQALPRSILTGPRIQKYCRWYKLPHRAIAIPLNGAGGGATLDTGPGSDIPSPVLHFVTPRTSQPGGPTLFYIHGGGYHDPIIEDGHVPFVLRCAKACNAAQVVFLEYSLAPEHPYPSQLVQAIAGLRYLLEEEVLKPENLVLGGDSAGGHLTLSLLAHIAQPSPYAPPLDLHDGRFKAAMLVSPWVTMTEEQTRALSESKHDYVPVQRVPWMRDFFKPAESEVWSNLWQPQDADTVAMWKRLFNPGAICKRAIAVAGTEEVLFDSCVGFGRDCLGCESVVVDGDAGIGHLKELDFVLAIAPGEAHVQPGLDAFLGYYQGRSMRAISTFLEGC